MDYKRLERLLEERKISVYKVSKETGIPYTCLFDWKTGRSKPKTDKMLKLAQYFGVSVTYFME